MKNEDEKIRQEIGGAFPLTKPYAARAPSVHDYLLSNCNMDYQFTLSGRSALGNIIDDIFLRKEVEKAYLPAYSCTAVVMPFIQRKIEVEFYEVDYQDDELMVDIQLRPDHNVFVFMQYFDVTTNEAYYRATLDYCREHEITCIENLTHCLLKEDRFEYEPEYSFASLRKWFAIPSGGIAYKKKDYFAYKANVISDLAVRKQLEGMLMKRDYLEGEIDEKEGFLQKMQDFEASLDDWETDMTIDTFSEVYLKLLSVDYVKDMRRNNARYLFHELRNLETIRLLTPFPSFGIGTPLFLPLVLEKDQRDALRQYMADHGVYLPVHPASPFGPKVHLGDRIVSLVCDQRYNQKDMEYIVSLIKKWDRRQKELKDRKSARVERNERK